MLWKRPGVLRPDPTPDAPEWSGATTLITAVI